MSETRRASECFEAEPGGIRLSPRGWVVVAAVFAALAAVAPPLWNAAERLEPGPDWRIPYSLSEDYELFSRACGRDRIPVLGDSVVWGHYVAPAETLTHYLNALAGRELFANLGVDGTHPAALEGLVRWYGGPIARHTVVVHLNLLWMSSPRHDLSAPREVAFNHARLVPQLVPWIDCYEEPLSRRIGIAIERMTPFAGWVDHIRQTSFEKMSVAAWTIEHPYRCPVGALRLELPPAGEPVSPPPGAEPWTKRGLPPFDPPWVSPASSFQLGRFMRAVELLRDRANRVFVLIGPFNEHMLKPEGLAGYEALKRAARDRLEELGIPCCDPEPLPSRRYADASHPLAEGYAALAERLMADPAFRKAVLGENP